MKTLDEVIDYCEGKQTCGEWVGIADALHYLKMYRSDQRQWEADREDWQDKWKSFIVARERHLEAVKELKRNEPLTWDELRQMEGKPVWVELPNSNRRAWGLNDGIYVDAFYHEIITIKVLRDLWHLDKEQMDTTWRAYRKERTE